MKQLITVLFTGICALQLIAQVQTVRGQVRDRETHQPVKALIKIITYGADSSLNCESNDAGEFILENVPLGRQDIQITSHGYRPLIMNNVIVSSAKEVIIQADLEEEIIVIAEVIIKAKTNQGEPNNENALVSARGFTVDETDRFAGSRGDPARMASNFAGVQGADDSRNDIVVRGNSPQGILWRLEGIDIPNPNHFAIPGTSGGPVSIINNKILANSDFFTGAFPAEFGNSTAGVFDLRMRNGNNRKTEFSSQLGFLGWDLSAEGPFSKKSKSSFMFTYRYSTLALFSALKIPIGTDAVPQYQDASFRLNFPLKNNSGLSVFGIGGSSQINVLISNQKKPANELYSDNDRDQKFGSRMGVLGTSFTKTFNKKSYFKITAATSTQIVAANHQLVFRHVDSSDGLYRIDSIIPNLEYKFRVATAGFNAFVNKRISTLAQVKYGLQVTRYFFLFQDSARNFDFMDTQQYWKWYKRWDTRSGGIMAMPYVQFKWKLGRNVQLSAGLNTQILNLKDNISGKSYTSFGGILPRIGLRYQLDKNSSLNFGTGIHSQMQPAYTYYYILPGKSQPHNTGMGLTKSNHFILGYDRNLGKDKRIKIETYYQQLYKIPVEMNSSSFSLANTGSGFSRFFPDSLENTGTGRNYGLEFTLEKFFTRGYYYIITMSAFDAKYKGSDGVLRNSDFNTKYAFNALIAKEWKINKKAVLNLGGKITAAGARRYSPIDTMMSRRTREYAEVDHKKNSLVFGSPYRRVDVRISYKINAKKVTHEIALDLVNITNRKNILKYSYIPEPPYFKQTYQLGFLPLFYYKLDF